MAASRYRGACARNRSFRGALALETGHKRNYYVKRALVEFLDRKEHLLGYRRMHMNGVPTLDAEAH
jgi:hypothetical protein